MKIFVSYQIAEQYEIPDYFEYKDSQEIEKYLCAQPRVLPANRHVGNPIIEKVPEEKESEGYGDDSLFSSL